MCFASYLSFNFLVLQIRPYVGCLVQYLPLLWKQSEEHNMLRCAILTTLIHLVQVWCIPNFQCMEMSLSAEQNVLCSSFLQMWSIVLNWLLTPTQIHMCVTDCRWCERKLLPLSDQYYMCWTEPSTGRQQQEFRPADIAVSVSPPTGKKVMATKHQKLLIHL